MRSINLHIQWGKKRAHQLPRCAYTEVSALGNMLGCRPGSCYDIKIFKSHIDFMYIDGSLIFNFFVNEATKIIGYVDVKMFMRFIQGNIGIQDLLTSATYTDDRLTVVANKEDLVNAIIKQGLGGK